MSKNKYRNKNKGRQSGEVLSGELQVSGQDFIQIKLEGRAPIRVDAKFTEDQSYPIPCNPGSVDCLDFQVISCEGRLALLIEWRVASTRTIIWEAYY